MNVQSQCLFIPGAALLGWVPRAPARGLFTDTHPQPYTPQPMQWEVAHV